MFHMSRVMRKPDFCIYENKGADQLRGNCEADQHLCFRYTDSTIPLLPKSKISSLYPSSVAVQPGLYGTRSKPPKTGFLTTRLVFPRLSHKNKIGGRTGLMVRASDSGSGDPGSILGRVGVFVSLSKRHLLPKSTGNTQE